MEGRRPGGAEAVLLVVAEAVLLVVAAAPDQVVGGEHVEETPCVRLLSGFTARASQRLWEHTCVNSVHCLFFHKAFFFFP